MKISVIIPFRNADAHLGRCIESCRKAQGDFEFVLVDDNTNKRTRSKQRSKQRHLERSR